MEIEEKLETMKKLFDKYEMTPEDRVLLRKVICEIKEYAMKKNGKC